MGKVETVKPGKPPQGAQVEEVNSKSRMKRIAVQAASSTDTKPVNHNFSYDANGSYIDQD